MLVSVVIPILAPAVALLAGAWLARHWILARGAKGHTESQKSSEALLPYGNERRILDNLNTVPWEWDLAEGRYTFIGKKVESLFGYPVEAWYESKIWRESLHPEDIDLVESSFMRAVWAGGRNTYRYRVIHRDGSIRRVESDISTLLEGNEPRFVCGTTRLLEGED